MKSFDRLGLWLVCFFVVACASRREPDAPREEAAQDRTENQFFDDAGEPETDAGEPETSQGEDEKPRLTPSEVRVFDRALITSVGAPASQSVIESVDLGDGPFASVLLRAELESPCSPWSKWRDDPPPAGHNWPLHCDAFDRNFEFTLDDPESPEDPPGFELVRAITPFGGPMAFDVDLTDLANARPGRHRLRAFIATYSDSNGQVTGAEGSWFVSASLLITPGQPPRRVLAALPLSNHELTATTRRVSLPYELPEGTTAARLEYRVTGHGNGSGGRDCIGGAEEFCKRTHTLSVDGELLDTITPWRRTCVDACTVVQAAEMQGLTYCEQNPCGDLMSVAAPRANWCPGTVTQPFVWTEQLPVEPGQHELSYEVSAIAPGGSWRTSAVLFAYGD